MTRRDFLLGAAAFGLGGWRLFAAPLGWKHGGRPNLVFGVVSDTHLRTRHGSSGKIGHNWSDKYFAAALEYFKSRNVDAVIHCGDFARNGRQGDKGELQHFINDKESENVKTNFDCRCVHAYGRGGNRIRQGGHFMRLSGW